jgi:DNA topoisomerase-1
MKCHKSCCNNNKCCNPIHWTFINQHGGSKPQWTVLIHNGPMFPPDYIPHKIPVIINKQSIILPPLAEEYATMYAKYIDTPYHSNTTFKKNFWKDFKPTLPSNINVKSIDEIDFSLIKKYLDNEKEKKNTLSKEEKENIKKQQEDLSEPFKYCIIDGSQQQVGNFRIEPPGIFIGRGFHPKLGSIKKRIYPEDVIINLSKDAPIPEPNIQGHKWGEIIHDPSVIWLASWKENISYKNKYIFTSFDSFFKSKSDESKFDLARQLKKTAPKIREDYEKELISDNIKNKQLATALYFIDKLALRVGGNKDTKEEADTVGVTSLRVEHITLLENYNIKLDFLGKDSVRYCKKVQVIPQIYNNINDFIKNKTRKDDIFDSVSSTILNDYLNNILPGLTAKVWRTYNASYIFQKEIDKINIEKVMKIDENERLNYLIAMFNQANTEVALLCNHQKNVNSKIDNTLKKIDNKVKEFRDKKNKSSDKDKIKKLESKIKLLKVKKETKIKMKNVSLGTSKNNYIDPRIIFAFIKKYNINPEKIFTKSLLKRFTWASKVDKDFKF